MCTRGLSKDQPSQHTRPQSTTSSPNAAKWTEQCKWGTTQRPGLCQTLWENCHLCSPAVCALILQSASTSAVQKHTLAWNCYKAKRSLSVWDFVWPRCVRSVELCLKLENSATKCVVFASADKQRACRDTGHVNLFFFFKLLPRWSHVGPQIGAATDGEPWHRHTRSRTTWIRATAPLASVHICAQACLQMYTREQTNTGPLRDMAAV